MLLLSGCAGTKSVNTPTPQPPPPPPNTPTPQPPNPIPEELRLVGSEHYPGQTNLTDKVGTNNLSGTLAILDHCLNPEHGCEYHPEAVKKFAIQAGVPDSHITLQASTSMQFDGVPNVPEGTRVAVLPIFPAYNRGDGLFLAKHQTLIAVAGANNMEDSYNGDRDIYGNPNHPAWHIPEYHDWMMDALRNANGRALLATWAYINPQDGTASPFKGAVMCGDAMHWCFAVRWPENQSYGDFDFFDEVGSTSLAAPILGAHAFYLSQLWDTAEEVFSVLRECAVDVGEPGPDREFGLGVPTAICDTVQNRAQNQASASLSVTGSSAVIPALLSGGSSTFSLSRQPSLSLSFSQRTPDLYLSFNSLALGKSFQRGNTSFTALAGTGYTPLGVSSSLTRRGVAYFAETGLKRTFLTREHSSVSFLAAMGVQTGTLTAATARAGLALHNPLFTLYTGATYTKASVPIPGHRAVGVPATSASKLGWEVSLHRSFSLKPLGFR